MFGIHLLNTYCRRFTDLVTLWSNGSHHQYLPINNIEVVITIIIIITMGWEGSSWKAGLMGKEDEEGLGDSGRRT